MVAFIESTQAKLLPLAIYLNKNANLKRSIIYLIGFTLIFIIFSLFILRPLHWNLHLFSNRNRDSSRALAMCRSMAQKEKINWNYFYYFENKETKESLMWCKTPKSGSTTITKMLLKLAGVQNLKNNTKIHKTLRDHYPRETNKIMEERLKRSSKFIIVRDPFERILSAYRDKLEDYARDLKYRDGYYYQHYGKLMTKGGNATRREPTFKEFVNYLIKTPVGRYDEHWMPISRLCSPCTVDYNYIIRLENFDNEIKIPFSSVGIFTSKIGWAHRTGSHNSKVLIQYFKTLALSEVKKLYARYKKDFLLFGYTPFKYFKMIKNNNMKNS